MTEYGSAQKELEALYAELPTLDCQGKCQESCGPIGMSKWENVRIRRRLKMRKLPPLTENFACPLLLANGKCRVYHVRPMICRLWGLVEAMKCPHGCVPERWLSYGEGKIFLLRADIISAESDEERQQSREAIAWIRDHPDEMEEQHKEYQRQLDEFVAAAANGGSDELG